MEGSLEEVLECSICLETLSFKNKVLPCQHTFCTACLQDVIKKQGCLHCPECRSPVLLDISTLPPNILLNRMLERLNLSQKEETSPGAGTDVFSKTNSVIQTRTTQTIEPTSLSTKYQGGDRVDNGKCLVTITPSNYQNVSAQPVIKERIVTSNAVSLTRPTSQIYQSITPQTIRNSPNNPSITPQPIRNSPNNPSITPQLIRNSPNNPSITPQPIRNSPNNPSITPQPIRNSLIQPIRQQFNSPLRGQLNPPMRSPSHSVQPMSNQLTNNTLRGQISQSVILTTTTSTTSYVNTTMVPTLAPKSTCTTTPQVPSFTNESASSQSWSPFNPGVNPSPGWPTPPAEQISLDRQSTQTADRFEALRQLDDSISISRRHTQPNLMSANFVTNNTCVYNQSNTVQQQKCQETKSLNCSPAHNQHQQTIPGNLTTNPFLDLMSPASQQTKQSSTVGKDERTSMHDMLKDWQLSPRALLPTPPKPVTIANTQASQLTAGHATTNQLTAGHLATNQLSTGHATTKQLINTHVANNQLTAGHMATNQLTTDHVTSNQLTKGHVTSNQLTNTTNLLQPVQSSIQQHKSLVNFQQSADQSIQTNSRLTSLDGLDFRNSSNDSSLSLEGGIYEAYADYATKKDDEIRLIKGDKYLISELYEDGWCKGKNLRTGDIGVCPSNHLRRYSCKQAVVENASATTVDASRLEMLKKMRQTLKENHARNLQQSGDQSAATNTGKGERYRCIVPFPASSQYELTLQVGDVITLVRRREDGWSKGIQHRTGQTGLFPQSFVERIG